MTSRRVLLFAAIGVAAMLFAGLIFVPLLFGAGQYMFNGGMRSRCVDVSEAGVQPRRPARLGKLRPDREDLGHRDRPADPSPGPAHRPGLERGVRPRRATPRLGRLDYKVVIWDTTAGGSYRPLHTLDTFGDNVVAFSPDGRRLGFADMVGGDNAVHLYDPATGEKVLALRGYSARLNGGRVRPHRPAPRGGGEDGSVVVWDADRWTPSPGEEPLTLAGHGGPISAVAFSPDGRRIATAHWDHSARIWDAADGKLRRA